MLTLYELRWSHYCEKIRLALAYLGLPYRAVGISPFSKRELQAYARPAHLPNFTVPALLDGDRFVMDSTPVLRHLAQHHDPQQRLFPGNDANRAAIEAKLLEFDTLLALPARRFGYSQLILESPSTLPRLFMPQAAGGFFTWPGVRWVAGHCLGIVLCKRFDFHQSESLGLYEALEGYLLRLAGELDGSEYVVGERFSAADLALAAQLRPITIVPFFRDHPGLQGLFARQAAVFAQYSDEGDFPYQTDVAQARRRRAPYRRSLSARKAALPFALPFAVAQGLAGNDQRNVWDRGMWAMLWRYRGVWHGKRRLALALAGWR